MSEILPDKKGYRYQISVQDEKIIVILVSSKGVYTYRDGREAKDTSLVALLMFELLTVLTIIMILCGLVLLKFYQLTGLSNFKKYKRAVVE